MSSTNRASKDYVTDPKGFFETPEYSTRAVLPFLGITPGMRILESGCGKGAIAVVLREEFGKSITITGVEIDKKRAAFARKRMVTVGDEKLKVFDDVITHDFLTLGTIHEEAKYDLDLSNPWFAIFQKVAEQSFRFCKRTCLLLPANALASKDRFDWWEKYPAHLHVLDKRPSFAKSVKCEMGKQKCSFQELIPRDEKHKTVCPLCGAGTTVTSSDSNEYAFYEWGAHITHGSWKGCRTPAPRKI